MANEKKPVPGAADPRRELQERITEIRKASFESARRGYDKAQVRRYLEAISDWLEGLGLGDADRGEMRRELAWVGERTSEILTKAEETASELREQGESSSRTMRSEAEADAERMRSEAEAEAKRMRSEASAEARETVTTAEGRAEAIIAEATKRRQDLQALIGDLLVRRDEIVADGVRLADELTDLFATTIDVSDEGDEGEEDEDQDGGDEQGSGDDEPSSGPTRTRRFDPSSLEDEGDAYDEDGVRIPLADDAGPAPMRPEPGETTESDSLPDAEGASEPDTEEQSTPR